MPLEPTFAEPRVGLRRALDTLDVMSDANEMKPRSGEVTDGMERARVPPVVPRT
jgi:hypothetical protein